VIDDLPRLIVDPDSREPATVVADTMIFSPDKRVARPAEDQDHLRQTR